MNGDPGEDVKGQEAIDSTYNIARDMGANAVINFNVNNVERRNGAMFVPGIEVTGFAIDRKGHEMEAE